MRVISVFILLVTISGLLSCDKVVYLDDSTVHFEKTRILGHRGGGDKSVFLVNTILSANEGFERVDGIEIDVQVSKNGTIWLAHDIGHTDCPNFSFSCFPNTEDQYLTSIDSCGSEPFAFNKLEEVFVLMSEKYPDKYISIDVKSWFPCDLLGLDVLSKLNEMGDEIIRLTGYYSLNGHVIVESEIGGFLSHVRKNSEGIQTHLLSLGDFESGVFAVVNGGYHGMSHKFSSDQNITKEDVQVFRSKGLTVQFWTVNSQEDIDAALALEPDFIQTDNLDFFESFLN